MGACSSVRSACLGAGRTLSAFAKLGFELGVEWLLAMRADPNVADRAEAAARALCGYPSATLGYPRLPSARLAGPNTTNARVCVRIRCTRVLATMRALFRACMRACVREPVRAVRRSFRVLQRVRMCARVRAQLRSGGRLWVIPRCN